MEYMDTHELRRNVKPVCKRFNSLATEVVDKRPQGENCDQCELDRVAQRMDNAHAVSYKHLTLTTILLV